MWVEERQRQIDNYCHGSSFSICMKWWWWIYLIRLVCSVLTLCERHFNSVTHEEKLRGPCVDCWHECMLNGFSHWSNCFSSVIGRHVCYADTVLDWCNMSRFNNDSVTLLTCSWCCILVSAHVINTNFNDIFMVCIYLYIHWGLYFISVDND